MRREGGYGGLPGEDRDRETGVSVEGREDGGAEAAACADYDYILDPGSHL